MTSSDTTEKASPSSQDPQSPPPAPRPPVTAPPLGVANPFLRRRPTPSTTTSDADSYGVADPVDELEATGSTRSSSTEGAVKVDTKSLRDLARGAVLQISRYVNGTLARQDDPEEEELWIARDLDQAQIGDPIAKLVGRKGLGDGALNADMANLIESAIGVAAYLVFHAGQSWSHRRAVKRLMRLNGAPTNHETGAPA